MIKMTVQPQSRRKPGPPPTGKGKPVQVRLQPAELAALDAYRGDQTRPAAIRAILKEKLDV
ncbi:MAG: hypothetical protein ACK57S_02330 [Brevundimonas sp.]|jgi:hypothetical protein|uniref:hypothetical protein n=1 Tax=Brevundimonas sp. TaxID=1871086 RepID=UPI00391F29A6